VDLRIGIGTDVHRLAEGRPMRIAGLDWPEETVGPEGHSDGDVVLHAICDALLSAASLGDLGSNFGTSDPEWAGADSNALVAETLRRVSEAGWTVGNVAVQLIGNRPRLGSRLAEAEAALADHHGLRIVVNYERFLADPRNPQEGLAALARFCGLEATAEAGDKALDQVNAGRAKAFQSDPELNAYYDRVKSTPWMRRYGYGNLSTAATA